MNRQEDLLNRLKYQYGYIDILDDFFGDGEKKFFLINYIKSTGKFIYDSQLAKMLNWACYDNFL